MMIFLEAYLREYPAEPAKGSMIVSCKGVGSVLELSHLLPNHLNNGPVTFIIVFLPNAPRLLPNLSLYKAYQVEVLRTAIHLLAHLYTNIFSRFHEHSFRVLRPLRNGFP